MTLSQMAEFVDHIVDRCTVRCGKSAGFPAEVTTFYVVADDVVSLRDIADRLHMMAPHAAAIRRVVIG